MSDHEHVFKLTDYKEFYCIHCHLAESSWQRRQAKEQEQTPRAHILNEANRLTHGPRDGLYGTPRTNHERIAALWSAYLETPITPAQAATCMALLKVARIVASPNEADHYIDGAAYIAIAGELATEGEQQ